MVRMSIFILSALALFIGRSIRAETIEEFLQAFHANPAQMMQRLPPELDAKGVAQSRGYIKANDPKWNERLQFRDELRSEMIRANFLVASPYERPDSPEQLIEPGTVILKNLREINDRGLNQASLPVVPWTDSYWPLVRGNTGYRYSDARFPRSKDWQENFNYIQGNPASLVAASGDQNQIDRLSPSEKYDLVLGDSNFTLTRHAWRTGQIQYERTGSVPNWMGICHGWAAASHMMVAVPKKPLVITAANGAAVTFFPQDVKALHSMLWANSSPRVRFAGRRCNVPSPARNMNGRIIDKGCFDVNPATWHLGIVNQLGQNQRSLIMDATYDLEVWNHPVSAFRFRYFNPQTWKESTSPEAASIPIENFRLDKFKEFRSPAAKSVIGIFMDVTYVVEINPSRTPNEPIPPVKTLRFIYDLELDSDGGVIGGEWYSNAHPDFLWTYDKSLYARTLHDAGLANDSWNPALRVPPHWAQAAEKASTRGAPLQTFVSRLLLEEAPPSEEMLR